MQDFQTNPVVFCLIVSGMTALIAIGGAWKAFFEEPAEESGSEGQ